MPDTPDPPITFSVKELFEIVEYLKNKIFTNLGSKQCRPLFKSKSDRIKIERAICNTLLVELHDDYWTISPEILSDYTKWDFKEPEALIRLQEWLESPGGDVNE
jgi:hypothetical protein